MTDQRGNDIPLPPDTAPSGRLNRWFDSLTATGDELFGCEVPPYMALGVCGVAVAFATFVACGLVLGLPLALGTALLAASLAVFVLAGLLRKRLGRANHVLLEDVLLVLAVAAAVAWGSGQSVARTLDVTAISLGVFLVFGRLGCLIGGCCHGRPSRVGVRYHDPQAVARPLLGLRLFPIQLVEAAWTLLITAVSLALLGRPPGTALWCWLLAYGTGRFVLEFARGDAGRPRLGPLSEAQWLAIALVGARIALEALGRPLAVADLVAAGGAVLLALIGRATRRRWLLLDRPAIALEEVVPWQRLLAELEAAPGGGSSVPRAAPGPGGVQVSLTVDRTPAGTLYACSLSSTAGPLDARRGFALAGLITQRLPRHRLLRAMSGSDGVFHVWALIDDPAGAPGSSPADRPELVRYRALAFARAIREAPAAAFVEVPAAAVPSAAPPYRLKAPIGSL
jgi:hypothetical protein